MKIFTFYSESHGLLYDLFKESLSRTNPNLEMHVDKIDQFGNGVFMEEGWQKSMTMKMDQIIGACEQGEIFIHSDSDVYFLGEIEKQLVDELGNFDIAFQDDGYVGLCMGFFICRPSENVLNLFKKVRLSLGQFNGHDQNALNSLIPDSGVSYKKLSHLFFNYGQKYGKVWGNENFDFDPEILLLHANWTIGIENKIRMIDYVRNKIGEK